jgi:hypothetical protein
MYSVTARIGKIKQPKGGYVKPAQFSTTQLDDGKQLSESENINSSIVGTVVDYLTRFAMGSDVKEAFKASITGYSVRARLLDVEQIKSDKKKKIDLETLTGAIRGLDDNSIIAACQTASYDVWFRNPIGAVKAKGADEIVPDRATIDNIKTMVERSIAFWKEYGKITADGFIFAERNEDGEIIHNGYTQTVSSGDGDYLTKDTMWDFKVSKSEPTNKHTLQLLMYWIMGQHSGMDIYKNIDKVGIFNPRLNKVYLLEMNTVSQEIIKQVEDEVICY